MADQDDIDIPPNQQALNPDQFNAQDNPEQADAPDAPNMAPAAPPLDPVVPPANAQIDQNGVPAAVLVADLVEAQVQARLAVAQMNQMLNETRQAQTDLDQQREEILMERREWERQDQLRQQQMDNAEQEIQRQQAQAQRFIQEAALVQLNAPQAQAHQAPPYRLPAQPRNAPQQQFPIRAQAPHMGPVRQQPNAGAQPQPGAQPPRLPQIVHQGPPQAHQPPRQAHQNAPPPQGARAPNQDLADIRAQLHQIQMQPQAPQHQVIQQMTLEEFHGKEGDDWLGWKERIESLFDDQGLPYARRRARFHLHLRGSALTFWSTLPNKEHLQWQEILQRFDARYASPEVADHYEREFNARKFKPADGEAPHDYLQELTRLAQLAFRAYTDEFGAMVDNRDRERENAIKKQFIHGMPPRIRNALIMKNHPHTTSLDLANYARKKLHADKVTKEEEMMSDTLNNLQAKKKAEGDLAPSYSALVQAMAGAYATQAAAPARTPGPPPSGQWKKKLIFTRNPPAQGAPQTYNQAPAQQHNNAPAHPQQYRNSQENLNVKGDNQRSRQNQNQNNGKGNNRGNGGGRGGKGNGKGGKGKRGPIDWSQIRCHFCGEMGHMHSRCEKMLPLLKYMPAQTVARNLASMGADKGLEQMRAAQKQPRDTSMPVGNTASAPTAAQLHEMQLFAEWKNSWTAKGQGSIPVQVAAMDDQAADHLAEVVYEETDGSSDSGDLVFMSGNE